MSVVHRVVSTWTNCSFGTFLLSSPASGSFRLAKKLHKQNRAWNPDKRDTDEGEADEPSAGKDEDSANQSHDKEKRYPDPTGRHRPGRNPGKQFSDGDHVN